MRILLLLIIAVLVSCKDTNKPDYTRKDGKSLVLNNEGEKLFKAYCYSCHNASTPHEARIAPPMFAVKNHYKKSITNKSDFIEDFTAFVLNPNEDNSKMPGAIKKFGLMPKQGFKREDIEAIAIYVYDSEFEKPGRFQMNSKGKGQGMDNENKQKKELGFSIANKTKLELGKNLMGAIQKEGTVAALSFCNEKAYSITDEMASKLNATIKRVSDKPRNQENKADQKETGFIKHFQSLINKEVAYEPIIENLENGKTQFYAPIVTNAMCLQCHGTQKNISNETLKKINELYPQDLAKGYAENQVRGLWKIQF